jgi:hypothetical protein
MFYNPHFKGCPGAAVKLSCDHEVMGSSPKNSTCRNTENVTYIRPKMVKSFPEPCTSGTYVHRAALYKKGSPGAAVKLLPCDHEVMGSSKQPLAEMQGKTAYIRSKVNRPFPRP